MFWLGGNFNTSEYNLQFHQTNEYLNLVPQTKIHFRLHNMHIMYSYIGSNIVHEQTKYILTSHVKEDKLRKMRTSLSIYIWSTNTFFLIQRLMIYLFFGSYSSWHAI